MVVLEWEYNRMGDVLSSLHRATKPDSTLREKAAKLPPIEEVKTILYHSTRGALSTFSQVLFSFSVF
ncbi:hypothetical protein HanPI659440_Chr00c13g0726631 [Helianthus annuus]|nr:hypothetical protein HanPI659440_Chr00c13g0726631 [Helianthus annuus]